VTKPVSEIEIFASTLAMAPPPYSWLDPSWFKQQGEQWISLGALIGNQGKFEEGKLLVEEAACYWSLGAPVRC
jgi:hypothetical protein